MKSIANFKMVIEPHDGMRVPAVIYTTETLSEFLFKDKAIEQIENVAKLPGIQKYALGMSDIHEGYGFPIGGVAAFDADNGVVSPGGVGFDINCGVRVIKTRLTYEEINKHLNKIGEMVFNFVPSGLGSTGKLKFTKKELKRIVREGMKWALNSGFAFKEDLHKTEENGCMKNADPSLVSEKAFQRGREELGTLGAGNHFLEIDRVSEIFDDKVASEFGLFKNQIVVWIHTGSRGFGHQVASDYIALMRDKMNKYGIPLFDKELVSLPIMSPEADSYLRAMAAAANYAWVNRQLITYHIRAAFSKVFKMKPEEIGMSLLYDVAHNIAKFERYSLNGRDKLLLVHRKGATRAFPAKHHDLSGEYLEVGQPVLLPGDMKNGSFILVGSENSIEETFGSVAHGAGRVMSRHKALKEISFEEVYGEMIENNINLITKNKRIVREEAPEAYKDVNEVIKPIIGNSLAKLVAKTVPLLVIKG